MPYTCHMRSLLAALALAICGGCQIPAGAPPPYHGAPVHPDGTPVAPPTWWTNTVGQSDGKTVGQSDDKTVGRSERWPETRAFHLNKESVCAWCGGTEKLQVHHVAPFHVLPGLELADSAPALPPQRSGGRQEQIVGGSDT